MEKLVTPGALGLVGNEALQKRLFHYLRGGRLHPALILSGPDREAKLSLARNTAKFLLCRNPGAGSFCGECSVCRRIEKDLHPDVLILREDPDEPLKVEHAREVTHQMTVSPIEATHKIAIVEECHRMNAAAANAFLKTLEEPGPNRLFLLLTPSPGALLPTLTSRCLEFTLKPTTAQAETASPEQIAIFERAVQSGDPTELVASLKEKDDVLRLVRHLQTQGRERAVVASDYAEIALFEALLELEGRLRSNANYGLMMDGFFRAHFLPGARPT